MPNNISNIFMNTNFLTTCENNVITFSCGIETVTENCQYHIAFDEEQKKFSYGIESTTEKCETKSSYIIYTKNINNELVIEASVFTNSKNKKPIKIKAKCIVCNDSYLIDNVVEDEIEYKLYDDKLENSAGLLYKDPLNLNEKVELFQQLLDTTKNQLKTRTK